MPTTPTATTPSSCGEDWKQSSPDERRDLVKAVVRMVRAGVPEAEVVSKAVEAGWSREFAAWTFLQATEHGEFEIMPPEAPIEIPVRGGSSMAPADPLSPSLVEEKPIQVERPSITVAYELPEDRQRRDYAKEKAAREWAEYEEWLEWKRRTLRKGTVAMVVAVGVKLAAAAIPSKSLDESVAVPFVLLAYFVTLGLGIWGAVQVLDAKGHSRWACLLGLFTLLFPDKNRREAPSKPSTGYKPEGAVFSDW